MHMPDDISTLIKELDGMATLAKKSGELTTSQIIRSCVDNILACCYAHGNVGMTPSRHKMITDLADLARGYYRRGAPIAAQAAE